MSDLEPVTREEKAWVNDDLTPITRKEMYIKHLYDETQVIPEKPVTREEMFLLAAAEELHEPTIEQLTVHSNGTYSQEGVAYSPVIVDVPSSPVLDSLEVTSNGTYTPPSGVDGYNEVNVNVPLPQNAYLLKSVANLPQAIATFADGAEMVMPSLTVGVEAVQDLHGYDGPWVGGAGKNKANVSDGSTTSSGNIGEVTLSQGTYTYSIYMKRNDGRACRATVTIDGNVEAGTNVSGTSLTRSTVTFTINETKTVLIGVQFLSSYDTIVYERVQVESGGTATSFEPYSNICPISGWDAANVSDTGINVWDEEWEVGNIDNGTGLPVSSSNILRAKNYINVVPNTTYFCKYLAGEGNITVFYYDINKNFISLVYARNMEITTPNNCKYIRFKIASSYGTTYNNDISINYPSTDTDYHAYNGNTYTIDLNGTRYGGKVDVVNGTMTVDRASVDMGDLYWNYGSSSKVFTASVSGIKSGTYTDENLISSIYPVTPLPYSQFEYGLRYDSPTSIGVKNPLYTDATAFKTAMSGVQLVYELATPLTIQLTPTAVKSLVGENNLFADSGEILEGEYLGGVS